MNKTLEADCYRSMASLQEKVEKLRKHPGDGATIYWSAPLDLPAEDRLNTIAPHT
jgi:hypothetical protein